MTGRGRLQALPALALLLALGLAFARPSAAGEAGEADVSRPSAEAAEPAPSCSACTGSLVKSWRIRKGDPKRPPETKSLKDNNKKAGVGRLAE